MRIVRLAFILALSLPAFAQTAAVPVWYTVTPENPSQSIVFPVGTTYRFGNVADNKWNPAVVSASASPVVAYYTSQPADPDPNVGKVFQVLQTKAVQSIPLVVAWTGNGAGTLISKVTVPALPATPPAPKPVPTITATYTGCTINTMSDGTFTTVVGTCKAVTK